MRLMRTLLSDEDRLRFEATRGRQSVIKEAMSFLEEKAFDEVQR